MAKSRAPSGEGRRSAHCPNPGFLGNDHDLVFVLSYLWPMRLLAALAIVTALLGSASPVLAWGDLGHKVTALIAYRHLTPKARATLDTLLASDEDPLTPHDFASRATWADKYRNSHRETAQWHFVDIEIDHPDLRAACFGFPVARQPASSGLTQDCIVDKVREFETELASPSTSKPERLLALKFLIHFVGDLHQPLHASDHQDRGGNCIGLASSPDGRENNLHAYWDTGVVQTLGRSADQIAAKLDAQITRAELVTWGSGDAKTWAMESFQVSLRDVYNLQSKPTCSEHGSVVLSTAYEAEAAKDAAVQLERAGVRMAALLNRALGR